MPELRLHGPHYTTRMALLLHQLRQILLLVLSTRTALILHPQQAHLAFLTARTFPQELQPSVHPTLHVIWLPSIQILSHLPIAKTSIIVLLLGLAFLVHRQNQHQLFSHLATIVVHLLLQVPANINPLLPPVILTTPITGPALLPSHPLSLVLPLRPIESLHPPQLLPPPLAWCRRMSHSCYTHSSLTYFYSLETAQHAVKLCKDRLSER